MNKKFLKMKTLFALGATAILSAAVGISMSVSNGVQALAEGGNSEIATQIDRVEMFDNGQTLMFYLTETDYMTAPWSPESNEAYHWYLSDYLEGDTLTKYESLGGQLAYEDRTSYNMPNAIFQKNMDFYNFGEYITVDGVALKDYTPVYVANKYTRVDTLGITVNTALFAAADEIVLKAGCTLPTMEYAFFDVGEGSALVLEEDYIFRRINGAWTRWYPFDGYEKNVEYDATGRFFYTRQSHQSFYGYPEAYTCEITSALNYHGLDDEGYSLACTAETQKGNLMVLDLVNPIDTREFSAIRLRMFSHFSRSLATYNAYEVTAESKGEVLETFEKAGGFVEISLLSALYANEEGMVDRLVFEFLDNGHENKENNQMFIASFSLGEFIITTTVYDNSFFIRDMGDNYTLTYRFNMKGAFTGEEILDTSKVLLNGVSVAEINKEEQIIDAMWKAVQGIYQINLIVPKSYSGAGAIVNADLNYLGNKMTAVEGLEFPNGELLDKTYTCNLYGREKFVDYELLKNYEETAPEAITWMVDPTATNNIRFVIQFDKNLSPNAYFHACEAEAWRETELDAAGYYNRDFSKAYVAGGFKSALYDCIVINGKTLAEIHMEDPYVTCIFVHYGQSSTYSLDISVDSRSATYTELLPLFESGEGVTIEIRQGLKFTTAYKTEEDYSFVLKNGTFKLDMERTSEMQVFFDGKAVENGATLVSEVKALKSSVMVAGVSEYILTETRDGTKVSFTIEVVGKEPFTFTVEEQITNEVPQGSGQASGCVSSVHAIWSGLAVLASAVTVLMRKKKDEENN